MREWIAYLGEIIVVTAVAGIVYAASPEGALKKHLHFIISLCVLASLAVPLFSMMAELPAVFSEEKALSEESAAATESALVEGVISASRQEIEQAIRTFISEQYDIPEKDIVVMLRLDAQDTTAIEIKKIEVTVRGAHETKRKRIAARLDEMFLGKSEIVVTAAE